MRVRLTCQSMGTLTRDAPPVYPDRDILRFSSTSGCPSSSPISVFSENETGRPLRPQLRLQDGSLKVVCMSDSGRGTSAAKDLCCESLCREIEPTRTTARRDVRKDRIERSWKSDKEKRSPMAAGSKPGAAGEGAVPFASAAAACSTLGSSARSSWATAGTEESRVVSERGERGAAWD